MLITTLEKYKGETFCLIVDGDKRTYIHRDIIAKFELKEGMEISSERFAEVLFASEFRRASRRAMYLINERDYSYIELFNKLLKNYPEDICFKVADSMAVKGFINDRRYAEQIVYSYMECKLYGERRVRQELYKRGIRGRIADEVLEKMSEGTMERLLQLIEKKYESYLEDPEDFRQINKVRSGLARAGYDFCDIKEAIKIYLED